MNIEDQIALANDKLKAGNLGITIQRLGDRLYLRGVFPPKPESKILIPYQQRIALGIKANAFGVNQAKVKAIEVAGLIASQKFDWAKYLKKKSPSLLNTGDWVDKFFSDYFNRRKETPKSLSTWQTEYENVFKRLPRNEPLTTDLLLTVILTTEPDTRTRKRFCESLGQLAKFAGLDVDFSPYKGAYSATAVNPRSLPDDKTIQEWFYKIPNDSWRWAYGILATYGLRPHELFLSELGDDGVLTVWEGKTTSGKVWPIYPEWVELFGLTSVNCPKCSGKDNGSLGHRVAVQFKRYGVPFHPYDLRHCWAVRSIAFGLPIALAAKQMRHSVKVHTDLYHHWLSDRHHQEVYDTLLRREDRIHPPIL